LWQLPVGWVSNLIIGFSVTGIFALLLVHPLKNSVENKWILKFNKLFFFIIIPLIVLLFVAIITRLSEYGITENRYYIILAAFWLSGITLYFILSKAKNIKFIPVSLFLIIVAFSFGPWGVFSVSLNNQINRLEEILIKNNIFVNGKISKTELNLSEKDSENIFSILNFLDTRNQYPAIQSWFDVPLDSFSKEVSDKRFVYNSETAIMEYMGINYNPYRPKINDNKFDYRSDEMKQQEIKGFDYLFDYKSYNYQDSVLIPLYFGKTFFIMKNDFNTQSIYFYYSTDSARNPADTINISITELLDKLKKNKSSEAFALEKSGDLFGLKIIISFLSGETVNDKFLMKNLNAVFLFSVKKEY